MIDAPTAIVAHDAGGAEVLSSLVRRLPPAQQAHCRYCLEGPALRVFARKLPQVRALPLQEALAGAARLLAGSGWQSDLEVRAIAQARARGLPATVFLDHWTNYRERFVRGGTTVLPDELWVGDAQALERARAALPEVPVRLVDNPYFLDLREQLAARAAAVPPVPGTLLVLCEPVREPALRQHGNERHWGYTEEEALDYLLGHLHLLGGPVNRIVLRPHPSEPADKYAAQAARSPVPVERTTRADVLDDILASERVAGCNSMALAIALLAGREVVCCIPPGGPACAVPLPGIGDLRLRAEAARA